MRGLDNALLFAIDGGDFVGMNAAPVGRRCEVAIESAAARDHGEGDVVVVGETGAERGLAEDGDVAAEAVIAVELAAIINVYLCVGVLNELTGEAHFVEDALVGRGVEFR